MLVLILVVEVSVLSKKIKLQVENGRAELQPAMQFEHYKSHKRVM